MEPLLILGTGVHAAEMVEIVERVNRDRPRWELLGFVSMEAAQRGRIYNGFQVLGSLDVLERYPDARVVPDNEWPRDIDIAGNRWISLVDPSVFASRTTTVGKGCVVFPNGYLGYNAALGDFAFLLSGCIVNHDVVLEDRVTLASGVALAGSAHIESDCYLGQSCTIRQNVRVGRGSLVGMGSVVVKDVPPLSVVAGNPARSLKGGNHG